MLCEIVNTEMDYVKGLMAMSVSFGQAMLRTGVITRKQHDVLFAKCEAVLDANTYVGLGNGVCCRQSDA